MPDSKANEQDLLAVRGSLDRRRGALRKVCKPKAGTSLRVTVVVDGAGEILGATADGKLGACVAEQLQHKTVKRTVDRTVQVTYPLTW